MNGRKLGAQVKQKSNKILKATRNTNQYEEKHYLHTNQHRLNTNQRLGILHIPAPKCDDERSTYNANTKFKAKDNTTKTLKEKSLESVK